MPENISQEEPISLKVSAILVAYEQADALRRSIAALEKSQDRERLEILVVDGGSKDGSAQLDTEFPNIVMLRLPHYLGATKAMNIGTRTAKGEYVFFLLPGVEVLPDTVSKLAAQLDEDSGTAAVCPLLVDANGAAVSHVYKLPSAGTIKGDLPGTEIDLNAESVAVEYPGRDALMVRKQFIQGMNYLDERYGEYWADADLAMQIKRGFKKIRLYPSIRAIKNAIATSRLNGAQKADRALGAAVFLGKYGGSFAGLTFRIGAIFRALGSFDFKQLIALMSGRKIDGSDV